MKIQYISDIHTELLSEYEVSKICKCIKADATILVLAGDIGNPFKKQYELLLTLLQLKFEIVFIIMGNHEYYNNRVTDAKLKCKEICEKFSNVILLDNNIYVYQDYVFLGTTLWSRIDDDSNEINDTYSIIDFTVDNYRQLHNECEAFIRETLENTNKQVIIISHHLPSYQLIHDKYKTKHYLPYNQWFATDFNDLLQTYNNKIKAWIYGHTHTGNETEINGVKLYCNPLGYRGENNKISYVKTFDINM